jgi:flagellar motility protein MotE (MotC chaperone)
MKKTGYDQFFTAAQSAKLGTQPAAKSKSAAPVRPAPRKAPMLKASRRNKPFPLTPVLTGGVFVCFGLGFLWKPEPVERFLDRIEVKVMGEVSAEEAPAAAAKPAAGAPPAEAKTSAAAEGEKPAEGAKSGQAVSEDLSYIEKLKSRKEELDLREKELNQLEEELQRQKAEVDARVRQLEQMRRDIASVLKERVESDETQVNKLVDLYSSMKPKQAADIIGSLQQDLAVEVLGKMKKKNAAEVMNLLPSDKARELSEKLTGYKR